MMGRTAFKGRLVEGCLTAVVAVLRPDNAQIRGGCAPDPDLH
jgi:hypothetical protein